WQYENKRGVVSLDYRIGRRRDLAQTDQQSWPLPLTDYSSRPMMRRFAKYDVDLSELDSGNQLLVFRAPEQGPHRFELEVNPLKRCVIEAREFRGDKLTQRTRFAEFVEAGGQWWPTTILRENEKGRLVNRRRIEVSSLSGDEFKTRVKASLESQGEVLFLERPDPEVEAAKQLVHEGSGDYADHLRVLLQYAETQQWDLAWERWRSAEKSIADKPAMPWMRAVLMSWSRRGENLQEQIAELGRSIVGSGSQTGVFLEEHLLNMAQSMLQVDEQGHLIEMLRDEYSLQAVDSEWCQQQWQRRRARFLQQRGQYLDAMAIYEELAKAHPNEIQDLLNYLQLAASQGQAERAVNLGRNRLREAGEWEEYELYQIYDRLSNLLWNRRKLDELYTLCAEWIGHEPTQEAAYIRYLSVLMFLGRETDADRWITARLQESLTQDAEQPKLAKIGAAIQLAFGQGWQFYSYSLEEKWLPSLRDFALRVARSDSKAIHLAGRIISNHLFRQSDAYTSLRTNLIDDLLADGAIAEFTLQRLQLYCSWINWGKDQVEARVWEAVTRGLKARWDSAAVDKGRAQIAQMLLSIYYQHGDQQLAIVFLRERLAKAEDQLLAQVARELMTQLVTQEWSEDLEVELFSLVPKLSLANQEPQFRAGIAAMAIRQLAESLQRMRSRALIGSLEESEQLPRSELRARQREVATRVAEELEVSFSRAAADAGEIERPWYALEALCFLARAQKDLAEVDAQAREIIAALMTPNGDHLDRLRRERCSVVLSYAATRR
ncbi:MAG: hypothetical protein ACYTG5_22480, partial [Planctomycetota bacterium]